MYICMRMNAIRQPITRLTSGAIQNETTIAQYRSILLFSENDIVMCLQLFDTFGQVMEMVFNRQNDQSIVL